MRTNHAIAVRPIREEEPATVDHGDVDDRPMPVPKASNASDNAAVTKAPAFNLDKRVPWTTSHVVGSPEHVRIAQRIHELAAQAPQQTGADPTEAWRVT